MAYILSKPKGKTPAQTRLCFHCNQTKPLSQFYSNRDWIENGKRINGANSVLQRLEPKMRCEDTFGKTTENGVKTFGTTPLNKQKYKQLNLLYIKNPTPKEDRYY